MNEIPEGYHNKPLIHTWTYCAKDGAVLGIVGRYQNGSSKKDIIPCFKHNGSGWMTGAPDEPRPLFGLNKLATHPKNKAVFICEGEKSAAAQQSMGTCAVSSLGGAQAANKADWTPLNGYKAVYLLPDNDEPGERYTRDVYRGLMVLDLPPQCKVLHLDGLPDGGGHSGLVTVHLPPLKNLQ